MATPSSGVRVGWLESESDSERQVHGQVMSPDTAMIVTLVGRLWKFGCWLARGPLAPLGEFSFVSLCLVRIPTGGTSVPGGDERRFPRPSLEETLASNHSKSVGEEEVGGLLLWGPVRIQSPLFFLLFSFVFFCFLSFSLCYCTFLAFFCGVSGVPFTDVFFCCG